MAPLTAEKETFEFLFGPVPSRRLGMSLGVDLMPHKTCTLDCVYCESGQTTRLTLRPDAYMPAYRIKAELKAYLGAAPAIDFITFSGSGEPLLHSGLGDIIHFIKTEYPQYKVAVLTNGTLLYQPQQAEQIREVDVLKVSVDAASEDVFRKINRPCYGLKIADIVNGLIALRKGFQGAFWVEVFLVPGINDTPGELERIKHVLLALNPDKVQLNTLDRPGTEKWVKALEKEKLEAAAALLLHAEIIKAYDTDDRAVDVSTPGKNDGDTIDIEDRLISTVRRRPCTPEDLSRQLGLQKEIVCRYLNDYVAKGIIVKKEMPRGTFYAASSSN